MKVHDIHNITKNNYYLNIKINLYNKNLVHFLSINNILHIAIDRCHFFCNSKPFVKKITIERYSSHK